MKFLSSLLVAILLVQSNATAQEKEWIPLFNGKNLDGWHLYNNAKVKPIWTVEDGALVLDPANKSKGDPAQDIVTDKTFKSFQLSIEWNIAPKGNSGLFWAVNEAPQYGRPYTTGPEIQVLDNQGHPDGKVRPNFHQAGSLYDMVEPLADVTNAPGEWNHFLITIDYEQNHGNVALNGTLVVEFPLYGPAWEALIQNSKFKSPGFKGFGEFHTGRIGLQDHNDRVAFRNIKIKPL